MADISPVKLWTTQEILTNPDLNSEFANVYNNHVSKSTAQTVSGRKTFTGGIVVDELLTVAAAGAGDVKLADFRWDPASGTLADDDGFYIDFTADDDAGTPNETIYARLHVNLDDVSNTTEDGSLHWWVMTAGTLTQTLGLTGAALRPTTTDAVSLGTNTLNFSDLFLDSGGVINFDSGNVTLTHSAGALTNSGTLTNTGLITATAGITSGSNIVSDTDSTDDLGTTTVRWANLYVDSIGDTGQALAITAGANNVNVTAGTLAVTGAATISSTLGVTSTLSAATGSTIGNLTLANGSITDSSGAISFGNENLTTTGTLAAGATTVTGDLQVSQNIGLTNAPEGSQNADIRNIRVGGLINLHGWNNEGNANSIDGLSYNAYKTGQDGWAAQRSSSGSDYLPVMYGQSFGTHYFRAAASATADAAITWVDILTMNSAGNLTMGSAGTASLDLNANRLILDADQDTHIEADTDDQIDIAVGGQDPAVQITGGSAAATNVYFNAASGQSTFLNYSEAGTAQYWHGYDASTNQFRVVTTNGDGVGTNVDVVLIADGTDDVKFAGGISTDGQSAPTSGIVTGAATTYINDSSNANMTVGLTINQGANDNEILALKSSDVAHGNTSSTETDTYFLLKKADAAGGGISLQAYAEDAALPVTIGFQSIGGTANTTKTAAGGVGLVNFDLYESNGADAVQDITADGNVFSVRARVGGSIVARFLIDEDGDMYSVTAGQTFDDHDDVALVSAYDATVSPKGVIQSEWEDFTTYNEEALVAAGVLGAPVAEGGMTNVTQLQRLHNGAIRQLGRGQNELKAALAERDAKIALLEEKLNLIEQRSRN